MSLQISNYSIRLLNQVDDTTDKLSLLTSCGVEQTAIDPFSSGALEPCFRFSFLHALRAASLYHRPGIYILCPCATASFAVVDVRLLSALAALRL